MSRVLRFQGTKYIFVFGFFALITFLAPLCGDDWHNYMVGSQGLRHMVGQAIEMYFDWEGRFVSRLLINFLTYYKFWFAILVGLLIAGGMFVIEHFGNLRHKQIFFLLFFGVFLFLDNPLFTQTILWVAGSITYLFPSMLLLGYFFCYFYFLKGKKVSSKWLLLGSFCFAFLSPMFVENIAISFVVLHILILLLEYYQTKCFNKVYLINIILSILGTFLMFMSPGSLKRSMMETAFYELSFLQQIEFNFPVFIQYTFGENYYLIFLMIVSGLFLTFRVFSKRMMQIISIGIVFIFPILCYSHAWHFPWLYIVCWIVWFFYLLFLVVSFYRNDFDKLWFYGILLGVGLLSNIVMMATPSISSRTSLLWILCSSVSFLFVLDDVIVVPKFLAIFLSFLLLLTCGIYGIAYYNLNCFSLALKQSIQSDLEQGNPVNVYMAPEYLAWGLTPTGDYHIRTFKEYFKIPYDYELVYQNSVWKYFIFFDEEATFSSKS